MNSNNLNNFYTLVNDKCCKLELIEYDFDENNKSFRILFKINNIMDKCPDENTHANTDANKSILDYRIELIIPNNGLYNIYGLYNILKIPATLETGKKYITTVYINEEQHQMSLLINNQNDVLKKWYDHLSGDNRYKNRLSQLKISELIEHFNTKFGSPYYVYGKFENIHHIGPGGAPSRKSRRARKSSKKSKKSGRKSRRNSRR